MIRAFPLPRGWELTKFESVVNVEKGRKPKELGPPTTERSVPYVNIQAFERGVVKEYCRPDERIVRCAQGDVLIVWDGARSGLVGKAPNGAVGSTIAKLHSPVLEAGYLRLLLSGAYRELNTRTKGVGIPHLDPRVLSEVQIPVAPRMEQRRIVEAIETRFARLDVAVRALERARANLNRFRGSVLEAACEGRLDLNVDGPPLWHEEPLTTSATGVTAGGWKCVPIEEVTPNDRPCAYGILQPGPDVQDGVPIVRVRDIQDGRIEVSGLKRVAPSIAANYPRTKLRGGEVLVSLVGAIGRTAVVPPELADANTARAVGVVPVDDSVESAWIEINLRRPSMVARLTRLAHEVARKTLNLEDLRKVAVPVPPKQVQVDIVAEVARRLSIAETIAAEIEHGIKRCRRLRDSILNRAFEGRLVQQDPNDEPASVLLERGRVDRQSPSGRAPRQRRTATAT